MMDRSGDRKRKAPVQSSSSNLLMLEPGWLSLDMATPFQCDLCPRAFTSQQALGGHQNAHRSNRLVHEPWRSQMAAQLKAIWQRHGLQLWWTMVQPLPAVPITMVQPSPNPFHYQIQQPPDMVLNRVPIEASFNVSRREGKKVVYAPGAGGQTSLILHDRSATASSSAARRKERKKVQVPQKRKVVQVQAPDAIRETLDLELRL